MINPYRRSCCWPNGLFAPNHLTIFSNVPVAGLIHPCFVRLLLGSGILILANWKYVGHQRHGPGFSQGGSPGSGRGPRRKTERG